MVTDTHTPRLDAFVQAYHDRDARPHTDLDYLLVTIHDALRDVRGDVPGRGPYGALQMIASAVESYLEDQEDDA